MSMSCQPCHEIGGHVIGGHSTDAYSLSMMGEGLTYHKRLRQRVLCPECDVELVVGFLETHWQVHYGLGQEDLRAILPQSPPIYTQDISDLLPMDITGHFMTGGRVSGKGHDTERYLGQLHLPPHVGHAIGP